MKRRRKSKNRFFGKRKVTVICISLLVILLGFLVFAGIGGLFTSNEDAGEMLAPIDEETGKINVLVVGVDKGETLTDTIMVASYDLDKNEVNILSIPRDTRMYVGNRYQKINTAYSISKNGKKNGIKGTIDAVKRLTGIPINYYVRFTCTAFRDTIDALDGVYIDVPQNMNYHDPAQDLHISLKKGYQLLDGDKAEQYVRFRRYPMGDIDRVKAQQGFVKALVQQKLNAGIITKLPDLYKSLKKNLDTNFALGDITRYLGKLSQLSAENVHMHSVPGESNGTDYGASYWIADMPALKNLIVTEFGYPADGITIHSLDGSSKSKDVKVAVPTLEPTKTPEASKEPEASKKPEASPSVSPTKKPTQAPTKKPTQNPTKQPEVTEKPTISPTKTPTATEKVNDNKNEEGGIKRPSANITEE